MKIGIFDPYLDDIGGGEKYMLTLAECLSEENEVVFFWDSKEEVEKAARRFDIDLSRIKVKNSIFSPKVGFLKKIIETKKYDSIVMLSDGSIPFSFSKKLFLHIQRPIEGAGSGWKNKIKLNRISGVFCNSYFTKEYIDKQLSITSSVVYPPVNLKPKNIKKENNILHVGRFRVVDKTIGQVRDYKKQGFMIEAFKDISKKLKDWNFILAVSVNEKEEKDFEELKKRAKGYPIEFVINKENDELWEYYSKSKIYWHASGYGEDLVKHPEYAEHFGISTVEAMGAGCVPVVINAGGQREVVEDNISGLLWDTSAELKEKTLMIASEDILWKRISEEARKRARDFAGGRFCEEVRRLIG